MAGYALARGVGGGFVSVQALLAALQARRWPEEGAVWIGLSALRLSVLAAAGAHSLALIADPRYRDFPVALYAGPALALVVLSARGLAAVGGDAAEERLLAWLLATVGVIVAILEGPRNIQALAWSATTVVIALTVLWPCRRHARRSPRSGPT